MKGQDWYSILVLQQQGREYTAMFERRIVEAGLVIFMAQLLRRSKTLPASYSSLCCTCFLFWSWFGLSKQGVNQCFAMPVLQPPNTQNTNRMPKMLPLKVCAHTVSKPLLSLGMMIIKQLLHTPPLNTMNYLHEVVDISRGRRPSEIFTTEGR